MRFDTESLKKFTRAMAPIFAQGRALEAEKARTEFADRMLKSGLGRTLAWGAEDVIKAEAISYWAAELQAVAEHETTTDENWNERLLQQLDRWSEDVIRKAGYSPSSGFFHGPVEQITNGAFYRFAELIAMAVYDIESKIRRQKAIEEAGGEEAYAVKQAKIEQTRKALQGLQKENGKVLLGAAKALGLKPKPVKDMILKALRDYALQGEAQIAQVLDAVEVRKA